MALAAWVALVVSRTVLAPMTDVPDGLTVSGALQILSSRPSSP